MFPRRAPTTADQHQPVAADIDHQRLLGDVAGQDSIGGSGGRGGSTPVPPALRLQQVATADVLALAVLAIEHPGVFTGERIEVASDAPTGQEAASVLSALLGRRLIARQLTGPGLPPGLAALFGWLARDPSPVDIGALRGRFQGIAWHSFGAWAKDQQAWLTEASGTIPPAAGCRRGPDHGV